MSRKIELTIDQEDYLKEQYEKITLRKMAGYLGVSMSTMQRLAGRYRLNRYRKKGWKRRQLVQTTD